MPGLKPFEPDCLRHTALTTYSRNDSNIDLSFAKIAYGDISLRCNAFVTVMQAAELWDLNDPSDTRDLPRKGTLLGQPQMRPRPVVISEIRSQGSPQMPGVQDHEMLQALSS